MVLSANRLADSRKHRALTPPRPRSILLVMALIAWGPRVQYPDRHPPLGHLSPLLPRAHRRPLTVPNSGQQLIITQLSQFSLKTVYLSNDTHQGTNLCRYPLSKWTATRIVWTVTRIMWTVTRIMKTCHTKTGHRWIWCPVRRSLLSSKSSLQVRRLVQ